nr:response regulator [Nitrosomonas nitrosa]
MRNIRGFVALIDDEESVRRALKRVLRVADFDVETFASGGEFMTSLQWRRPDCVIVDVHMPGITGFDVLRQLSKEEPSIPTILITAFDDPEFEFRAKRCGAYRFLRKPITSEKLIEAVQAAVGWERT